MKSLSILFFFLAVTSSVFSQNQKTYDLVKDFGAKPDNKTDCYAALMKAAQTISTAGGGTLNIPAGKYYLASYKILNGKEANHLTDVIFINCKNLIIKGNNSAIRINGSFTRSKDYTLPGVAYQYAYKNTIAPFYLRNCKNVVISDISIDGGVLQMKKEDGVVEGDNYGIVVSDENDNEVSSNISIKNVKVSHFAADGFMLRSNGENIVIDNCRSNNNGRLGLSIVKGKKIKCLNSSFDSTGFTGQYGWHAPGAGIDIENEFGPGKLKDITIRNCNFRSNKGFQIVTTLQSENVTVDSCFIADLSYGYSDGTNGVGMYNLNAVLSNSIIFGSIQIDLAGQLYTGPAIQQINNNIIYSGMRGLISASFSRPVNITDNILINLPKPQLNDYFPYLQNTNCRFNQNIIVTHADRIKAQPNQVTGLVQSLAEATNNVWMVNGYTTNNDAEQRRFFYLPSFDATKILGKEFFVENNWTPSIGYTFFRTLAKSKTDLLLKTELFTAFQQKQYDKKYLIQATTVKAEMKKLMAGVK